MQISDINKARQDIKTLEKIYFTEKKTVECTDRLMVLLEQYPILNKDKQSQDSLKHLTVGIYASKDALSLENQGKIHQLFLKCHQLKPTRIKNLTDISQPVKNLTLQKNIQAVICGNQKYPIPTAYLQDDMTPCKEYFKPIIIELSDHSQIEISLGLLSRFSEKISSLKKKNALPEKIQLDWINPHEFDTLIGFLETSQPDLINEKNALSCMYTGAYMHIPEVMEACKPFVYRAMDEKTLVFLLNNLNEENNPSIIYPAEKQISELLIKALTQKPISHELEKKVAFISKNLQCQINVNLSGSAIKDSDLELLHDFPLKKLELLNCPKLTPHAFSILETLPALKTLKLGGNSWVDDEALSKIPPNIEDLSLAGCTNFTQAGLLNLQTTHVINLDLMGCNQLTDENLALLPDQFESLDFRLCTGIGEKTLQRLSQMPKLKNLVLSNTPVKEEQLFNLPLSLTSLNLAGCNLSDLALKALAKLKKLKELTLAGTKITDVGLTLIPSSVETLKLDRCTEITDEGIKSLINRKKLKFLSLFDCPHMTKTTFDLLSSKNIQVGWQEPQASHIFINTLNS